MRRFDDIPLEQRLKDLQEAKTDKFSPGIAKETLLGFVKQYQMQYPANDYMKVVPGFPKAMRSAVVLFHNLFSEHKRHSHKRAPDAALLQQALEALSSDQVVEKLNQVMATYLLHRVRHDSAARMNDMGQLFHFIELLLSKQVPDLNIGTYDMAINRDNSRIAAGVTGGVNVQQYAGSLASLANMTVGSVEYRALSRYAAMQASIRGIAGLERESVELTAAAAPAPQSPRT